MPKKGSRRRRKEKFNWTNVAGEQALGALVDSSTAMGPITGSDVMEREAYVHGFYGTVSIRNHTAGEGPLPFGFAHSDCTAAEVSSDFGNQGNLNISNRVAEAEDAALAKFIRRRGMFSGNDTEETLGDSSKQTFYKVGMSMGIGDTLEIFVINTSGSTMTTGTMLEWYGQLVWKYR